MSIYRDLRLIWNNQIPFKTNLLRSLSNQFLVKNNYSTTDKSQNNQEQINYGVDQIDSTNLNRLNSNLNKKTRNELEADRLNALRERLRNEDNLKEFKEFLDKTKTDKSDILIAKRRQPIPYLPNDFLDGNGEKVFLETYGCQMNVNDSQIAASILANHNYEIVDKIKDAQIILVMTCSIREGAESKIFKRLNQLRKIKNRGKLKIVCLAGCMASRLKDKVLEKDRLVDIVIGPDSYRDLPNLLAINKLTNRNAVDVILSLDECYADIMPVIKIQNDDFQDQACENLNENTNENFIQTSKKDLNEGQIELNNWSQFRENYAMKAFVSIMRGCDNMCSYCVVPYTRGRERSRKIETILNEVRLLSKAGVKEITLLGQNVNSYRDYDLESVERYKNSDVGHRQNFKTIYKKEKKGGVTFDKLLEQVALIDKNMRIRFTSPHPKDFTDEVIDVISKYPNIVNHVHLPAQSGDNEVLERMRRGYTVETYLQLVKAMRNKIPNITFTSDFIAGFSGETEEAHQRTLDLIKEVKYSFIYMYPYSVRENTYAHLHHKDDVPADVKARRASEINDLFRQQALEFNSSLIDKDQLILIEGFSRKSKCVLFGRNESNVKVLVPIKDIEDRTICSRDLRRFDVGDYVVARVHSATSQTLFANPLYKTNLSDFYSIDNDHVRCSESFVQ